MYVIIYSSFRLNGKGTDIQSTRQCSNYQWNSTGRSLDGRDGRLAELGTCHLVPFVG